MISNKKAMSGVVVAIILVGLALVITGIAWGVINNLIKGQLGGLSHSEKCMGVDLTITNSNCGSGGSCDVWIKRGAGDNINVTGIKIIAYKNDGTTEAKTAAGNIDLLATVKKTISITAGTYTKLEVLSYFTDEAGKDNDCQVISSYNL